MESFPLLEIKRPCVSCFATSLSGIHMIYLCVCFARSKAESPDNQVNKATIRSKKIYIQLSVEHGYARRLEYGYVQHSSAGFGYWKTRNCKSEFLVCKLWRKKIFEEWERYASKMFVF